MKAVRTITNNYEVLLNELILVSHKDEFVSSVSRWDAHTNEYILKADSLPHRAFSIFLFNQQNKLLMQKRSVEKKTFPLCWTNTCCSHPNMVKIYDTEEKAEEPIRKSLHRALIRELKMSIPDQKFSFMEKNNHLLFANPKHFPIFIHASSGELKLFLCKTKENCMYATIEHKILYVIFLEYIYT